MIMQIYRKYADHAKNSWLDKPYMTSDCNDLDQLKSETYKNQFTIADKIYETK